MSIITASRHRRSAAALATAALALGGVSTAIADSGSSTPAPSTPPIGQAHGFGLGGPGTSLLSPGLFKAIFDVFGAVHAKVPSIAAPIIAQGVTDKTITQAQADQLTAIFAGHPHATPLAGPTARSTPEGPTGATGATGPFGHGMWLAPEQLKVLRKVMQSVMSQLPALAKPALDADVANGTITQKQDDTITSVLTAISGFKPGSLGIGAGSAGGSGAAASLNPLATLQSGVTARVGHKVAVKHHKSHKRHRHQATR